MCSSYRFEQMCIMLKLLTVTSQNLGWSDGVERSEGDRQANAGWVIFWNVCVYAAGIRYMTGCCFLLSLQCSLSCRRCYLRFVLLFFVSFFSLFQLFPKGFHLMFVRHATRFTKTQLSSRGERFARHLPNASVCCVYRSCKFRFRKQSICVCFLKALNLGVQRLEDFQREVSFGVRCARVAFLFRLFSQSPR